MKRENANETMMPAAAARLVLTNSLLIATASLAVPKAN